MSFIKSISDLFSTSPLRLVDFDVMNETIDRHFPEWAFAYPSLSGHSWREAGQGGKAGCGAPVCERAGVGGPRRQPPSPYNLPSLVWTRSMKLVTLSHWVQQSESAAPGGCLLGLYSAEPPSTDS